MCESERNMERTSNKKILDAFDRVFRETKPTQPVESPSSRLSEMELASLELEVRATDLYDVAHAIAAVRPTGTIDRAWWNKLERALEAYYDKRREWRRVSR